MLVCISYNRFQETLSTQSSCSAIKIPGFGNSCSRLERLPHENEDILLCFSSWHGILFTSRRNIYLPSDSSKPIFMEDGKCLTTGARSSRHATRELSWPILTPWRSRAGDRKHARKIFHKLKEAFLPDDRSINTDSLRSLSSACISRGMNLNKRDKPFDLPTGGY